MANDDLEELEMANNNLEVLERANNNLEVLERANNDLDVDERILSRKDDVLELVRNALNKAGLKDVHIRVIHLDITKLGPVCPLGQTAVWESERQPDGSVVFGWVCR